MGLPELLLILFILLLGVFSMTGDGATKQPKIKEPKEDKNLARLRQMQEWDRFDESNKEK